jgi:hypothetical protein
MIRTLPEVLYLCIGSGMAIFVTAADSSSRVLIQSRDRARTPPGWPGPRRYRRHRPSGC